MCQSKTYLLSQKLRPEKKKRTMYQRKVDADMLNAVNSVLADISSISPSSEQRLNKKTLAKVKDGYIG